jgi:hypothetical protein
VVDGFTYERVGCTTRLSGQKGKVLVVSVSAKVRNAGGTRSEPIWALAESGASAARLSAIGDSSMFDFGFSILYFKDDQGAFTDAAAVVKPGKTKRIDLVVIFNGVDPVEFDFALAIGPSWSFSKDIRSGLMAPFFEAKGLAAKAGKACP